VVAVVVGLGSTLSVVIQAILLGTIVQRALLGHANVREVSPQLIGLAGAFIARAALSWLGELAANRTSAQVTSLLRRDLLTSSMILGPAWLSGERTGEFTASATQGIDALDAYFARYLPTVVLAGLAPICVLAWIAWSDWRSFVVLIVTAAVVPVFMILLGLEAKRHAQSQWDHVSALSATFYDMLKGLPTLRAFNRESSGRQTLEKSNADIRLSTMGTLRVAFLSSAALETLASIGTALVALFLGLRLLDGTVQLGLALSVLVLAPEVYLPLRRAGAEFHASATGQAAAERILDLLDEAKTKSDANRHGPPSTCPPVVTSTIMLRHVSVQYPDRTLPALDEVNLSIAPGEHLAITGESGCGKSTLLRVLLGFVEPAAGRVSIGTTDLRDIALRDWRRHIAWVPQHPYLIAGTISDNLRVGDHDANGIALTRAVAMSGLAEFVARLPLGLETPVGEGGFTLSAGERQRIALGRAILRDSPLILLDEPTAHLDISREEMLRESIGPWLENRTVVVAAHRGGMVGRVDRLVNFVGGQLMEVPADPHHLSPIDNW
jgi:thiol reductant ABC exporter CydD subunit